MVRKILLLFGLVLRSDIIKIINNSEKIAREHILGSEMQKRAQLVYDFLQLRKQLKVVADFDMDCLYFWLVEGYGRRMRGF